ncbi:MAG: hypothetical protein ACRDXX_05540 [Stackebrandtia sp.]
MSLWTSAVAVAAAGSGTDVGFSTCLLLDDYFGDLDSPAIPLPRVLKAASHVGVG